MSEANSGPLDGQLNRIMEVARHQLEMDVVAITEFAPERQVYRALLGDPAAFGMTVGDGPAAEDGFCLRMAQGLLPHEIPDTSAHPVASALPLAVAAGVGAYAGVPIQLSDGSLFGSLACFHHEPHDLGERDVRFLRMLAELVTAELEAMRERDEASLRISRLIESATLEVALQPVFDVHDGHFLGAEALARFPSSFGSTESVFESAGAVGLSLPLERLAIGCAIPVLDALQDGQFLAVNLTPQVAFELAATGETRPELMGRMVLEITEHAAIASYPDLRKALRGSRDQGLKLAIDDAGAGYASLKHVVELEPDIIKIDRSIVEGVANDRARRSAVSAFVLLALDIGAYVIAEGVERPQDLEAIKDLGVDAAQGYLLARPTKDRRALARWQKSGRPAPRVVRSRDAEPALAVSLRG
ncbi:MAG TPA: EAL domain-containing protein [Frankiaceae bacterium]|nr:EAL domain-containing protein [Frankiaceae bacterium]